MKYFCWVCHQEVYIERKDKRGEPPVFGISYNCPSCGAYSWIRDEE